MTYRCSFCGKSQDQVQRLIAGPGGVYICDECVDLCHEIIQEKSPRQDAASPDAPVGPAPGDSGALAGPGGWVARTQRTHRSAAAHAAEGAAVPAEDGRLEALRAALAECDRF